MSFLSLSLLIGRSPVEAQGGQLEIAGVVVGQWGPNNSTRRARGGQVPPQVMSVGQRGRLVYWCISVNSIFVYRVIRVNVPNFIF